MFSQYECYLMTQFSSTPEDDIYYMDILRQFLTDPIKLPQLKTQRIITLPRDTVRRTSIRGHPSLGKPDQVVWIHERMIDEIELKLKLIIPFSKLKKDGWIY